jgi:hypothetical protein
MFKIKLKKSPPQPASSTGRAAAANPAPYVEPVDPSQPTRSSSVIPSNRRRGSRHHGTSRRSSSGSSSNSTNYTPPASKAAIHGLIHLRLRGQVPEFLRLACPNEECVICAEAFCHMDIVTTLPCGHMHHSDCIIDWLSRKCTCPTCRYEMPTDDKDFERCRAQRRARSVIPNETAATTPTTITSTTTSNTEGHINAEEDEGMGEEGLLVLQTLTDMVSMNRTRHVACEDHANFYLIVRRTLSMKEEMERQRDLVLANSKQDGRKAEKKQNTSASNDCNIPTDNTPIDHAHFLELYAGY